MGTKRKRPSFLEGVASLFESEKFSDFTITCGDKTWRVHKAIICAQSDVFEASTRFGKEATENTIHLSDDDPEIVGYMLECMYGGNYELGPEDIAELYWVTADMLPGEKKGNKASRRKQYAYEHRLYLASRKHFDIILATSPDIIVNRVWDRNYVLYYDTSTPEDVAVIEKLLHLFPAGSEGVPSPALENLMTHAKVYMMADKYFAKDVKATAVENFRRNLRHNRLFACDEFYRVIKEILEIIPENATAIRELIVDRVCDEKAIYGITKHPALKSALDEIPRLAYWVLCREEEQPRNLEDMSYRTPYSDSED